MIGKSGTGWQTTTADLALILFLVVSTASAGDKPARAQSAPARELPVVSAALESSPSTAVYRTTTGTTLRQWLAAQPVDDRQIVTVLVKRSAKAASPALNQGIAFLDQIAKSGRSGRLIVEPDTREDVAVVLAYDRQGGSGTALAAR